MHTASTTLEYQMMKKAAKHYSPIQGSIELTPLCNMNCKMCYVHLSAEEMALYGQLRSVREWTQLGEAMRRAGVLFLLLTGGEPLLYPGFKELFMNLEKMGMILTVNTNGTLIDEEWVDFFVSHRPRRINITLYGADAEVYRQLCGYPKGFEKVMYALKRLKESGLDVKISSSVTPVNQHQLKNIIEIGNRLNMPVRIDTYMMPPICQKHLKKAQFMRLPPEKAASCQIEALRYEMSEEIFQALMNKYVWEAEHAYTEKTCQTAQHCYAGRCSFSVNWQGKLRPCVMLHQPAVDVFEYPFDDAWYQISHEMAGFSLCTACSQCFLRSLCRNCPACAFLEKGKYDALPDYMCRYTFKLYQLMKQEVEELKKA